jgi:hypothetical protein
MIARISQAGQPLSCLRGRFDEEDVVVTYDSQGFEFRVSFGVFI